MKALRRFLPLVLAALAPLAPAQVDLPAQYWALSLADRPGVYDGLMVATPLGPPVGRPRPDDPWLASQPVRVEDSRAFAPGTVVDLYFESLHRGVYDAKGLPLAPKTGLPVGGRTLVVARLTRQGALAVPDLMSMAPAAGQEPSDLKTVALDPTSGPAALAEAAYPTTAARLPNDPEPQWRLYGSIAAAIHGASDADAKNLTQQIGDIDAFSAPTNGRPDDRLSNIFAGAVAKDTAYHRALVDYALNQLHYLGYEDRYRRDVLQASTDPNAFPDGMPDRPKFYEDPAFASMWPKDYKPAPPISDTDFWDALLGAKSPTIAAHWIGGLTRPSDADVRALAAKYLVFPDPRARWAMVERLAWWNGHPAPDKPTTVMDPLLSVERTDYPGLAEAVAYWKAKLGV